jgi:hypothetical protein
VFFLEKILSGLDRAEAFKKTMELGFAERASPQSLNHVLYSFTQPA